mgnify:CR=1 FL=1
MKRDRIIIKGDRVSVTGSDVWMSAAEIADLFNVTAASVNHAIRGILKSDVLNDYEVCRSVRINGRVTLDVYNMELIVPLAYRFDTYFTSLFRKCWCGGQRNRQKSGNRLSCIWGAVLSVEPGIRKADNPKKLSAFLFIVSPCGSSPPAAVRCHALCRGFFRRRR